MGVNTSNFCSCAENLKITEQAIVNKFLNYLLDGIIY